MRSLSSVAGSSVRDADWGLVERVGELLGAAQAPAAHPGKTNWPSSHTLERPLPQRRLHYSDEILDEVRRI